MKILILSLCLLMTFSGASHAYDSNETSDKGRNKRSNNETLRVAYKATQNWFQLEATLEAVNESTLSAQTSGRIEAIYFDVNDYVKKGALLVKLRDKTQKASLKRANAQLNQYKAEDEVRQLELIRSLTLFTKDSLSKRKLDSVKAQAASAAAAVKAARALQEQAQEQLNYTQVHAPYSGIVKTLHKQVGESVSPGSSLMTGLSLDQLRAVAYIPQRLAPQINQQKDFQIIHEEQIIAAQKVTLFPYANAESHSFKVRVSINSQGLNLFPGMWVKLNIPTGMKRILSVPISAIIQNGELSGVYVNTPNGALLRQVRLGERVNSEAINSETKNSKAQNGQIEILAGLREGEYIFIDAYSQLAQQGSEE